MIPPNSQLRKRMNSLVGSYFILNSHSFFEVAEEFAELQKKFVKETLRERIFLWFEMLVSPIMAVVMCYLNNEPPSIFTSMSFYKCIMMWFDWLKFTILTHEIRDWIRIVRSVGGPFISTNDSDYHVFVYADGMERLRASLGLSKESSKRLE
jgi:hypothetical protein